MTIIRPNLTRSGNFDHWLRDQFWNTDPVQWLWGLPPSRGDGTAAGRFADLAADLYEDADAFHAIMELPGVSKEDVRVELENAVLRVSGKHTDKRGESETSYEFSRSLAIPDGVEGDKIEAKLENGILQISMPKAAESRSRVISVS